MARGGDEHWTMRVEARDPGGAALDGIAPGTITAHSPDWVELVSGLAGSLRPGGMLLVHDYGFAEPFTALDKYASPQSMLPSFADVSYDDLAGDDFPRSFFRVYGNEAKHVLQVTNDVNFADLASALEGTGTVFSVPHGSAKESSGTPGREGRWALPLRVRAARARRRPADAARAAAARPGVHPRRLRPGVHGGPRERVPRPRLRPRLKQYRQAGHAALELLELADVDDDRLVAERGEELRAARAVGGDQERRLVEHDDVRARLLGDGLEAREDRGWSTSGGKPTIVPSGSAVTADFRCSTSSTGTATTVVPGAGRPSWRSPSRSCARRVPT